VPLQAAHFVRPQLAAAGAVSNAQTAILAPGAQQQRQQQQHNSSNSANHVEVSKN
jgi:hypothetical protein